MADESNERGRKAQAAEPDTPPGVKLPSGKTATKRKWKGRDLINAYRALPPKATTMEQGYAILSVVCQIDGKPMVYEDVLDMDGDDLMTLMTSQVFLANLMLPAGFLAPQSSPASSASDSHPES